MLKKWIGFLSVVALVLSPIALVSTPAQAVTACAASPKTKTIRITAPLVQDLNRWWDITSVVYYNCILLDDGSRRIDPSTIRLSYNGEDTSQKCNFFDVFERIDATVYVADGAGRNYNVSTSLPCDVSTRYTKSISLAGAPTLHYCDGSYPKYKVNYTVVLARNFDRDGTVSGTMWDFIGPVRNDC